MSATAPPARSLGLLGATALGVGAIIGGGFLALSGVALSAAGPSALLALALNGVIAVLSALSFAEMAAAFPQSGGTYAFAKRVLSVRSAFVVGWILWFASIAASVLYALGFASFALLALRQLWPTAPPWLGSSQGATGLALLVTALYAWALLARFPSGARVMTYGKLIAFALLIAGGLAATSQVSGAEVARSLTPFFAGGAGGLVAAMGFTFIAFQGFHLVAVMAGEVRDPARTIPAAMLISIGVALLIYLPLLFVIMSVGTAPFETAQALGKAHPETVVAVAAERFMGARGFWLVIAAALFSMLSALEANLNAASRIALVMARDRTLPRHLSRLSARGVPTAAVLSSAGLLALLIMLLPSVAAAGSAASLIFLVSFALVHVMSVLERRRLTEALPFTTPWYPAVPVAGALACLTLVLFQGVRVPTAGIIVGLWLILGLAVYLMFLARRARTLDALAEARDPHLLQLRGKRPLVLVPIANPANAASMVQVASALAPPRGGRVLLLTVVGNPGQELENAQAVLRASLEAATEVGIYPEALTTLADEPWNEIARVGRSYGCASLLLGLSDLSRGDTERQLERLVQRVHSDVAILRMPPGWSLARTRRILVAVGGKSHHDALRARLLGSLARGERAPLAVRYLRVLPMTATDASFRRAERALLKIAEDERGGEAETEVVRSDGALEVLSQAAADSDLLILGLPGGGPGDRTLGSFAPQLTRQVDCAVILLSHVG